MTKEENETAVKQFDLAVDVLMLAGTILLQSGSEIHRVEDTMIRIAHSQDILNCNVLAMPAAIFFSIENTNISRMKRITHSSYNIEKVCDVNQVSRMLVANQLSLPEAFKELETLKEKKMPYTKRQITLAATLCAFFFSLMFGGNFYDALGAALATILSFSFSRAVERWVHIPFVTAFAGAFVFGFFAQGWVHYTGFPSSVDLIIAGAVMPFVPGIALTNAIRDIITNHINSGMSKLFESLLIILALAAGTSLALIFIH